MSIPAAAKPSLRRAVARSVGWHLLAVAVSAVSLVIGGFALLVTLFLGGAISVFCSDGDPHFDTPAPSAYLPSVMATLVATAGMAVAIGAILRAGRVASPRLVGVIMALLGPAWLGSFAITSVYLGYQQQAPTLRAANRRRPTRSTGRSRSGLVWSSSSSS